MSKKKLVIVESPAKAKTIEKILGSSYQVIASYGHVRDLPKTTLGVKIEENFKPSYSTVRGKKEVIDNLKSMAKKASKVYLASDPDREGEAIAWHIAKVLKLDENDNNRIEFNEITESAVSDSIKNVRKIDMQMVDAQQARRILDRIVGYKISPLLWKTVSENTSAGRVQSVALKMICDLEDEIQAFIPEKYWNVSGNFENSLKLTLNKIEGKKFDLLKDEKSVEKLKEIQKGVEFEVTKANVTKRKKSPPNPLKTSTLQQLSSSYLGFSASKTMRVAQTLYEGLTIDGAQKGLITYMRTDSIRISEEAKDMARNFIETKYGIEYIGDKKPKETKETKEKKEKIQDAHEAVRPTDVKLKPEEIKSELDSDQYKLYKLIWDRFLISQMANMEYEQFEIVLNKDEFDFRGTTNKIIFDGYYKIFKDEEELPLGDFPKIEVGDIKKLEQMNIKEEWTKPPARMTESSLVKKLEAEGIGRPSTYASIIETLKKRDYVMVENKSFFPTELGGEVKKELQENFKNIMNVKFTAVLEDKLDKIASGEIIWTDVMKEFYEELEKFMVKYGDKVAELENRRVVSDIKCDCSDDYFLMKTGRFGKYLVCENEACKKNITLKGIELSKSEIETGFIKVKEKVELRDKEKKGKLTNFLTEAGVPYLLKLGRFGSYLESENFSEDNLRASLPGEIKKLIIEGKLEEIDGVVQIKEYMDKIKKEEQEILSKSGVCEKCGQPFKVNRGRFGKFLSCTGYPVCENIKKLDKEGNIIIETEKKEKKATTKKKAPVKKKTVTKSKKKV
ncbi:MAG: type I DNA topoisomerase [Fusobacteriaceae bacterium]